MSEKNKDVLIGILLTIIIGLIVLIILITTNTISFGSKVEANQNENNISETRKITESEAISIGKKLYDKMTEIKETSVLYPYCGVKMNEINNQTMKKYNVYGMGEANYYESKYNNLDELKNDLSNYMSEEYINEVVYKGVVTDLSLLTQEEYGYSDYIIDNNKMYCRAYNGKGWLSHYIGNYEITAKDIEDKKIEFNIRSIYIKQDIAYEGKSDCSKYPYDINNCTKDELDYKDTTFIIEKNSNDKWIVTNFKLHD